MSEEFKQWAEIVALECRYNWNRKVRPLPDDMEEYIDWQFYNFETTRVRADILMKMFNIESDIYFKWLLDNTLWYEQE